MLSRTNTPPSTKVPATATIPAGKASVTFPVDLVNNRVADGDTRVTITASKGGLTTGTATLDVLDDDAARPRASLAPSAAQGQAPELSLATASVRAGVQLRFWSGLDVEPAQDALAYQVSIGGEVVKLEGASYDAATRTVTLALPEGTLSAGERLEVSWRDLQALDGSSLSGTTQVTTAP